MSKKLLIRADACTEIGIGHVMRCLALSQAWLEEGGQAGYLCSEIPEALAGRLVSEGLTVQRLGASVGGPEDAAETVRQAQTRGAEWVAVDGYRFGGDYQRALAEAGLKVLFVDDYGHAEHYVADLVLNQNLYATNSFYESRDARTRLLLGTNFALLRREFWKWRDWIRPERPEPVNVLVTLGGGDPNNASLSVLEALASSGRTHLDVTVVAGVANPHESSLRRFAEASGFPVHVERAVSDMPSLMAWADLAISAAGSTTWELLFMGLPSLVVVQAENQELVAEALGLAGAARLLDATDTGGWSCVIARFLDDGAIRGQLSRKGRDLVDGLGAARVVGAMLGRGEPSGEQPR